MSEQASAEIDAMLAGQPDWRARIIEDLRALIARRFPTWSRR